MDSSNRKGFWDFCCEHPLVVLAIAVAMISGIGDVTSAITGHYEHDHDGFWSSSCVAGEQP